MPVKWVRRSRTWILLEHLSGLLEDRGRILEEVHTLFEHPGHLLEQTALILEDRQYIRTNKFILELLRIY
ncbi:phosphomannomutase [Solibacillus sp. FSL W7-1464]|uniref:phosphomannomutase n=1 Tax=Solibacillus sp. FSL W7-1464 TaxID=2921706 RepID=UPI0030F8D89F